MATTSGLAGPREDEAVKPADKREVRESPETPQLNERHLRIVHSAETPSFTRPVQSRPIPRPVQAAPAGDGTKCEAMLDRAIQGQIGSMLRDVFADVESEPVPSRFVELLEALGAQEKHK
jgi:hypothetical protein